MEGRRVKIKNRQQALALLAIVAVALLAGDKLIFTPLVRFWKERAHRIAELRQKVKEGTQLQQRQEVLRGRWEQMRTNTLPDNLSQAEQQVLAAFDRWSQESRISITSISPQWKTDADEFMTLQCRVDASGNLSTLSRFLYDIEKDPLALRLETVEITSRDNEGQQLTLGLQISGLVLTTPGTRQ
jgi:hypothetical protein